MTNFFVVVEYCQVPSLQSTPDSNDKASSLIECGQPSSFRQEVQGSFHEELWLISRQVYLYGNLDYAVISLGDPAWF